jgi:hypothetical protein
MSPMQLNRSPELSYSQINDIENIVDMELDKEVEVEAGWKEKGKGKEKERGRDDSSS